MRPLPFGKHSNDSSQEDKRQEDLLYLSDTDVEFITYELSQLPRPRSQEAQQPALVFPGVTPFNILPYPIREQFVPEMAGTAVYFTAVLVTM